MSTVSFAAAAERVALGLQSLKLLTRRHTGALVFARRRSMADAPSPASRPTPARRFAAWFVQLRRQAARRRAIEALDDRMLADIGIDRSEIDSVLAEQAGLAEITRMRLAALT